MAVDGYRLAARLSRPRRASRAAGEVAAVCGRMPGSMDQSRLQQIRPFADLTIAERNMLARVVDEFSAPVGAALVSEGDLGYEFMVIEQGTVDVIRGGERIETLGPGDFFGELAVLADGAERNATVVARTPVRGLRFSAHDMRIVRERLPRVGEQIDKAVAERTA
jgi:CRP-like cAMP-binding protein